MELPRQVWESTQISSGSEILYTCGVQAKFLTALAFFFCAQERLYTDCMAGKVLTLKGTSLKVFLILPHRQHQSKRQTFHQV